ncbi:MAG: ribonuclease Y [Spirochaetaceae bacterium]|nr:ribonuclease Y [Spirochaetaceae bacterium]
MPAQLPWIVLSLAAGIGLGWLVRWLYARLELASSEQKAQRIVRDARQDAEARKREAVLETKDELLRERNQLERETRARRNEVQRHEQRLLQKEENLEKRREAFDRQEKQLVARERAIVEREDDVSRASEQWIVELEQVAKLTADQARKRLVNSIEDDARHEAQALIHNIEAEAKQTAERKAREVVVNAMQRLASETTSEVSVTSVSLPNDDMKGRIIGREGRNIRTLENLTGVDIIIDDTPEAVVLSCFDPLRKETARLALERLITDGRIHPARIEEIVRKVHRDLEKTIEEDAERVLFDLEIPSMHHDLVMTLGRLKYRTSYGQNQLAHAKETAQLGAMIAAETGGNIQLSKRASLLHDIGKAIDSDENLGHAVTGMELARRCGEDEVVCNAIGAHHYDVEPSGVEAIIVQIADTISASRPGARRESLDNYLRRLENLERIATGYAGVDRAYAIQAGRELRVMVSTERVSDDGARELGRQVAKQIEAELKYPGRIKVTVIRETRVVEYAR